MSQLQSLLRNRQVAFLIAVALILYLLLFVRFDSPQRRVQLTDEEEFELRQFSRSNTPTLTNSITSTLPRLIADGEITQASNIIRQLIYNTNNRSSLNQLFKQADKATKRLYYKVAAEVDGEFSLGGSLQKLKERVSNAWKTDESELTEAVKSSHTISSQSKSKSTTHDDESSPSVEIKALTLSDINKHVAAMFPYETVDDGFIVKRSIELTTTSFLCGDGEAQCTIKGDVAAAAKRCAEIDECEAFVCSTDQTPQVCYLRKGPYKFKETSSWDAFYTPKAFKETQHKAQQVIDDYKKKLDEDVKSMKPGSKAAVDFNFNGVCGENGYKCVISYGLYGSNSKYVEGAIENAKILLQQQSKPVEDRIFDGWQIRIYHDASVPVSQLKRLKDDWQCELVLVDNLGGNIAGMFWRFLVAGDDKVDRYVIRDTDSRLNPREWAAVKEWMNSGFSIHSIRDHPNHDRPLNGGMWGGVKGAVKSMRHLIEGSSRNHYTADLTFLTEKVWPQIELDQIAHDSYSCTKYRNSHPFPNKRPDDFQHVGQVFENGKPRMGDIEGFLKGNPNPVECRLNPDWIYG